MWALLSPDLASFALAHVPGDRSVVHSWNSSQALVLAISNLTCSKDKNAMYALFTRTWVLGALPHTVHIQHIAEGSETPSVPVISGRSAGDHSQRFYSVNYI